MGNTKSAGLKDETTKHKPKLSQSERKISPTHKKMSRASMSSQGNRRPILTVSQRAIIKYCIDNSKDDIADRIIRRATEKKDDFKGFLDNLPRPAPATVAISVHINQVSAVPEKSGGWESAEKNRDDANLRTH
ncbi:hypothetical protein NECAME_04428 [Necator americanus]|uniref:Uncharacterized protein n=1 Tax=Necator americanus TaxID=51031 RepID=W2ST87_NECAM|nr:hypothetical protein NECAME_04428 [Necator americanus]ETN72820.1 hypothetical protein NECAME_04428 [Necator americanus]